MSLIKMKEFFVDMLVQRGLKQKELPQVEVKKMIFVLPGVPPVLYPIIRG
jgi:hypothetical protein